MSKYAAPGTVAAVTTGYKSCMILRAPPTAMRRIKLGDFVVGAGDVPADNVCNLKILRSTTVGTLTDVVPTALDPADAACVSILGNLVTVEPTTGGVALMAFAMNQRATYRWVAAPGEELIIPATANNGLAIQVQSPAYASVFGGSVIFEE